MFIKMPGRKHLGYGRLKEIAFQIRFWQFLLQSPLRQCFCILHKEKARNQVAAFSSAKFIVIEQTRQKYGKWGRKMFILWKNVCSVRKRAYKKAYLWPIDYCTFKQNTREKNVQKTVCSGTYQHINQLVPRNKMWIPDTTAVKPVLICFCFNNLQKLFQTDYQQYIVFAFFLKKIF